MINSSFPFRPKTIARFPYKSMAVIFLTTFLGWSLGYANEPIRPHQTTRLKSTAGTGVGSFLMDEATLLNPAPLAFYNVSSLYYQRNSGNIEGEKDFFEHRDLSFKDSAIIASDAGSNTGGSFSYTNQKRGPEQRKALAVSMAKPFGEKSALGVTYKRVKDTILNEEGSENTHSQRYNIFNVGVIHALGDYFSLGILLEDPLKTRDNTTLATLGFQYLFHDYIALMFDIGSDYSRDIEETMHYRGAIQVMFYNDFFLRAGFFKDKDHQEKGNGMGLGWVGPKLVFEFSIQNIKVDPLFDSQEELTRPERDIKETSFSIAYRF